MPIATTLELLTDNGEERLVVTKKVVETRVYTRNLNRPYRQVPLGRCLCTNAAFQGRTFQTSMEVGLDALIKVGIIGRPVETYCFGEHIEVTYEKENYAGDEGQHVDGSRRHRRVKTETAYICINHTPAVLLALVTPKQGRCCHPRIESHVREHNPGVTVTNVLPSTDGNGRTVNALPLVLRTHAVE